MNIVLQKIELKFKPNYLVLFSAILALIGLIIRIDRIPTIFFIIGFSVIGYFLYSGIKSTNRIITVGTISEPYIYFLEKTPLGENNFKVKIEIIERVWIYKRSLNFIPTETTIKYRTMDGHEETFFEVRGVCGYLSKDDQNKFLMFLKSVKPTILFGYEE